MTGWQVWPTPRVPCSDVHLLSGPGPRLTGRAVARARAANHRRVRPGVLLASLSQHQQDTRGDDGLAGGHPEARQAVDRVDAWCGHADQGTEFAHRAG